MAIVRAVVGRIGESIIYALIWLFGRRVRAADVPWLIGPVGREHIGDRPYEETAEREGLTLVRDAHDAGLIPRFAVLASETFAPDDVDPRIRAFYERTGDYRLDTWASTYFPANVALWLLVTTISRRVRQLDLPLDGLSAAKGMKSEIVLLKNPDGTTRYTGWFRRLREGDRVAYTGFYTTTRTPLAGECVKTVFPMPRGNATVILRPRNMPNGGLRLESKGRGPGDAGFYRMQEIEDGVFRSWYVGSLHETLTLFIDEDDGNVRCEHAIRFLGLPVLTLYYRTSPRT